MEEMTMSYIDKERILNESPKKQLIIGFNNLKKDFNDSNANEYSKIYKNQPLSFIINNSRLIFSEPFYGYAFYSNIICGNVEYCLFHEYESELDKINNYINENHNNMSSGQLKMYIELKDKLTAKIHEYKNTIFIVKYAVSKENVDTETLMKISDELYRYTKAAEINDPNSMIESKDNILKLTSEINSKLFFALAPYIVKITGDSNIISNNINNFENIETDNSDSNDQTTIENTIIISKLAQDNKYMESINAIPNKLNRGIFKELAITSVRGLLDEIITEKVDSIDTYYSTPNSAVNQLFNVNADDSLYKEEYDEFKKKKYGTRLAVFECMLDMILFEYQTCENPLDPIQGYNYFNEGTKIQEALIEIADSVNKTSDILGIVNETSDEDIDKFLNDEYPKAKNKANDIQFKAMDAEVQQNKKRAEAKQKGQEVRNAVKAATQLPKNVINDIKDQIHKIDDVDDTRRKKYMSEPGFRKKAFRNLKLALLYGGAAKFSIASIPVVAICRHYSKDKDRRIRNELYKELETDIKVCDEKINDANANGDNKAKYQLMRLKSKLESEKARVKLNSKYI